MAVGIFLVLNLYSMWLFFQRGAINYWLFAEPYIQQAKLNACPQKPIIIITIECLPPLPLVFRSSEYPQFVISSVFFLHDRHQKVTKRQQEYCASVIQRCWWRFVTEFSERYTKPSRYVEQKKNLGFFQQLWLNPKPLWLCNQPSLLL